MIEKLHILIVNRGFRWAMNFKTKITRELLKATSDKTDFNKTVLKWKKHFNEAGKVIGSGGKKKK